MNECAPQGKVLGSYNGEKDDVSIDEIYQEMPFYKESKIEKEKEIQVCTPHPLGIKLYNYALEKKKIIYITSDMYLDKNTIISMLNKCGISKWDNFLLSSEQEKKKDTGKLYEIMISQAKSEKVEKEDILHLGDNWKGDVDMAKLAGIDAIRFNPVYEESSKLINLSNKRKDELSQIGKIWDSFCSQSTKFWSVDNVELSKDFYTKLGFELTGPLATMMAMHVRAKVEEVGAKKIVFMARDGRVIKNAFDCLYEEDIKQKNLDSLYLSLSRSTVVSCNISTSFNFKRHLFFNRRVTAKSKKRHLFYRKSKFRYKSKKKLRKLLTPIFLILREFLLGMI